MKPAKPWYRSRTMAVNLLVATLLAMESQLHWLQPMLPVNVYQLTAFVLPLLNVWLRVITRSPIARRDNWRDLT